MRRSVDLDSLPEGDANRLMNATNMGEQTVQRDDLLNLLWGVEHTEQSAGRWLQIYTVVVPITMFPVVGQWAAMRNAEIRYCDRWPEQIRVYRDDPAELVGLISHFETDVSRYDDPQTEALNNAYTERNQLAALLSKVFPAHMVVPSDASPGWGTVVIIMLPTGQISFHIPDRERYLFHHLRMVSPNDWDGHSTETKWMRCDRLTAHPNPWHVTHSFLFQAMLERARRPDDFFAEETLRMAAEAGLLRENGYPKDPVDLEMGITGDFRLRVRDAAEKGFKLYDYQTDLKADDPTLNDDDDPRMGAPE